MADFVEWYDGTGGDGYGAGDDDGLDLLHDLEAATPQRAERDAVLFLVDCSSTMFKRIENAEAESGATPGSYISPFSRAVRCALTFYQEKVVTSDKDLVSLLLYNTRKKLNLYEFQGVYVFHEFDCPSAARIQELQVLGRAGSGDVNVLKEFEEHIGHCAPRSVLLSEAFWAAQHMFHNLRSRAIGFRRVFLFTDCDDPCAGISMERERCFARMKDLHDAGVALEVFAHGADVVSSAGGSGGGSASAYSGASASPAGSSHVVSASGGTYPAAGGTFVASPSAVVQSAATHPAPSTALVPTSRPLAAQEGGPVGCFVRSRFWDALIAAPIASVSSRSGGGLSGSFDISADDEEYCGAVHVSSSLTSFDSMVSDVKIRTNPQRISSSSELRVGFGPEVPKVIVHVYIPILKCAKPKFTWLDGSTNTGVTTETRLLSKATGAPVAPADVRFSTTVAGEEIVFTTEDKKEMKEACASNGSSPGFTILGFKKYEDAIRFKYNVSRAAFLHCTAQKGGGHGALKFFVQLHRTLLAQNKVAIAELVSRVGVAPRIVALVPSRAPRESSTFATDSVSGTGFHLVHIPYADDIRSFHPAKQPPEARPTDDQVTKVKRVIRKLHVDYDVDAIANPALQRQYKILQQLALIDPAPVQVDDLSLPDVEGMKKMDPIMKDFTSSVFSSGYDADMICPQPKPAKKPPTAEEMGSINFDDLEARNKLDSLTIPFLQQYLKLLKEDVQGAKLKHELVARVGEVVRKRRTVKREREE